MSAILVDVQRIGWTKSATFRPSHDPMQYVASEIKERLLKAIDRDHNVVDMPGVLAVISQLEKASITREDLEQTRLGKYVNEVRKKTSNDSLAKRAKKLVKTWQKLALPQHTAGVNGERAGTTLPAKRSSQPGTPSMSRSASLASLSTQESNADLPGLQTPSTAVSSGRLVSPAVSSGRLVGPAVSTGRLVGAAVSSGRLVGAAVSSGRLVGAAVSSGRLVSPAVSSGRLVSPAVSSGRLVSPAVSSGRLASPAVSSGRLVSPAVSSGRLASPAVSSGRLVSPAVSSGRLVSPAVSSGRLVSPAVSSGRLVSPAVSSGRLVSPAVSSGRLVSPAVSSGRLVSPAVSSGRLVSPAVSSGRLVSPAVSSGRLVSPAVSSGRLVGPAVSSGRLVGPVSSETLVGAGATNSRVSSPGLHGGRVSPGGSADSRASSPCARSRTPPASERAAAPTPQQQQPSSGHDGSGGGGGGGGGCGKDLSETNTANRKRRRSDTDASPPPTKLHANSVSKRGVEMAVAPPNGLLPGTLLGADARDFAAPQECRDDSPPDPGRTRSDAATSEVATPSRGGGGVKLAKVKTTAELIAGLKAHNTPAASMMNSPTMDAIAARRIRDLTHDEEQSRRASVIPDSMRKRKYTRRKAAAAAASSPLLPAASDTDLSKVKTEMVAKFLETSRPPPASAFGSASEPPTRPDSPTLRPLSKVASGVDLSFIYSKLEEREARPGGSGGGQAGPPLPDWVLDHDPDRSNDASATYPKSPVAKSEPLPGRERVTIEEELRAIYGQLSPLREVAGEEEEQQQEEEEGEEAEEAERKPVTEEEVDRICNEQWEGVNGWYDHQGAWKDWNLCFSHPSHAGEFVHVLPYVNIDE